MADSIIIRSSKTMNTKTMMYAVLVLMAVVVFVSSSVAADQGGRQGVSKATGTPVRTWLNINNISTQFTTDGISDIDASGNSGLVFPAGSRKTAVFCSGFLWGVKIPGDPQVRVGGSAYRTGLQQGKILPSGVPEDPNLTKNRIYRVRPDEQPGSGAGKDANLTAEVRDEGQSESAIRTQYETDWTQWPVADGAPYDDVDHNGQYDPAIDIPGLKGANQTIYFVCNDLNSGLTTNLYGAIPVGMELHVTIWAYSQQGALGNMFFKRFLFINKSTTQFDSVYVSQWSDVDLGNSTDDFAGCDTTRSLGYVYNATAVDATYGSTPPPATGFDFFQGPIVPGAATDSAIFRGKVVHGKKNLPMTAFYYFARGDPAVTDPTQGTIQGSTQFYNFFRGRIGLTGALFNNPVTNGSTTFALSGDPQTRSGWIDGRLIGPGDRRIGVASGPFTMAPRDTQEVVVAEICAGAIPGTDRLSAIGLLKFYDDQAQVAYNNFFDLPVPPPPPVVTVSELDRQIVLEWGANLDAVRATETSNSKGYAFQGYNVYQLPTSSSTIDDAKRIATFDIIDGIGKIKDFFFDASKGEVLITVKQFGNDTGLKRFLSISEDVVRGGIPLVNGIRYYFAVTAYNYNPDPAAVPNNLENPLTKLTIVPHGPDPGTRYTASAGDTGHVSHVGVSDGTLVPYIVDPRKLKDKTYTVNFKDVPKTYYLRNSAGAIETLSTTSQQWAMSVGSDTVYRSFNQGPNVISIPGSTHLTPSVDPVFGDLFEYPIIDGVLFSVTGSLPGMKSWAITSGTRRFSPVGGFTGLGLEGFSSAGDPTAYDQSAGTIGMAGHLAFGGIGTTLNNTQYRNVLLKLAAVNRTTLWDPRATPTDPNFSRAYRYLRAAGPPAQPSFAPWIINVASGYPYQAYDYSVPFSAWDMETNPPTRLAVGCFENNVTAGLVDGRYWPPLTDVANSGPREFAFIFKAPYTETPNPALAVNISNNSSTPLMWVMVCNRRADADWVAGDEFLINANHPNVSGTDVFTYTAQAPKFDAATAKGDISQINVFPNPYYGVNTEELNKYQRFVTFNHLPVRATIRIFNLAGINVRTIEKNSNSQFERWDLSNDSGLPVGSGM
jgi:hypothetical protein